MTDVRAPGTQADWQGVSEAIAALLQRHRYLGFGKSEGDVADVLGREVQLAFARKEFAYAESMLALCLQYERDWGGLDSPDKVSFAVAAQFVPSLAPYAVHTGTLDPADKARFDTLANAGWTAFKDHYRQLWALQGQRHGHRSAATSENLEWTLEDSKAATAEGWDVFDASGRGPEIERVDGPEDEPGAMLRPAFENDAAAIGHVYHLAQSGSRLHQKALLTLARMKGFEWPAAPAPQLAEQHEGNPKFRIVLDVELTPGTSLLPARGHADAVADSLRAAIGDGLLTCHYPATEIEEYSIQAHVLAEPGPSADAEMENEGGPRP